MYAFRSDLKFLNWDILVPVVLSPSHHTISRQIMRNWEPWKTNIDKSNNHRMLQQLAFHKQQTIKATIFQDLDPRPCANNAHSSVLAHEMADIEPGEIPSRTLTWKPLVFLSHIKHRTNDDCRRVKRPQRILRFTIGWFTNWENNLVPLVTGLKYIKLHLGVSRNEVTWKSKTM